MIIRNDMNISYVRVLNASPDAPAVDIYINGGLIFKNIKFLKLFIALPRRY